MILHKAINLISFVAGFNIRRLNFGEKQFTTIFPAMAVHAHFTVADFVVFSLTLLASMGIGIFYSRAGGAQQNNNEYLMAGRSMASIPVAISVLASFVSSIAILGNPAEVYTYGFQYWINSFTNFISVPIMALVFLPVYYNLRLTSSYEVGCHT